MKEGMKKNIKTQRNEEGKKKGMKKNKKKKRDEVKNRKSWRRI